MRARFNPQPEVTVKRPQIVDHIRALPTKNKTPEAKRRYTENRTKIAASAHELPHPNPAEKSEPEPEESSAFKTISKGKAALIGGAFALTGIAMAAGRILGAAIEATKKPKLKVAKKSFPKKQIAAGKALTTKVVSTPMKTKARRKFSPVTKTRDV